MKLIIAGSRNFGRQTWHLPLLKTTLDPFINVTTEVVSGGNHGTIFLGRKTYDIGADWWGEEWARQWDIPIKRFLPDWAKHGRAAGPLRNKQMVDYADALVAFWDGKSKGTANVIELGRAKFPNRVKVVLIDADHA